jgi:hypothetical protein
VNLTPCPRSSWALNRRELTRTHDTGPEADYNFVIGLIFGRQALYSGVDKHHTLHPSQWAQPGRQCADVVVMSELTLAMAHMLKIELGGFENDAAACYDRVLINMQHARCSV